jgi:hypothetical protein
MIDVRRQIPEELAPENLATHKKSERPCLRISPKNILLAEHT